MRERSGMGNQPNYANLNSTTYKKKLESHWKAKLTSYLYILLIYFSLSCFLYFWGEGGGGGEGDLWGKGEQATRKARNQSGFKFSNQKIKA